MEVGQTSTSSSYTCAGDRLRDEAPLGRAQIELRPARAAERPLALGPLDEALSRMAHLEHDRRLPRPSGVLALEEVAKEPLLQADPIVRVEVRPVLDAVHLEPLLGRGRAHEHFEVAAGVEALPSPVR